MSLKDLIFGTAGGAFAKDERIAHSRFSEFLPWVAYNPDNEMYYLRDNAACWIYEASPLILATSETYKTFADLYKISFPEGTIIQSIIYADPYVDDILDAFIALREQNEKINPLFMAQARNYAEFIREGTAGLRQLQGTPLKNFRFFFSIRIPIDANFATDQEGWINGATEYQKLIQNALELLKSAGVRAYPLRPDNLITTMYRLLNPDLAHHKTIEWDESKPINKQIIYADTVTKVDGSRISFGSLSAACLTPKVFPREITWTLIKNLIGYSGRGVTSQDDDMNQILCPFIYTLSVIIEDTSAMIDRKAMLSFAQKAKGTSSQNVGNRQSEAQWLLSQKEQNEKMIKVIPQLLLFSTDGKLLDAEVNHVRALWERLGCPAQEEAQYLIKKMFVSAFPGGLHEDDFNELYRHHIVPSLAAGFITPVESGFSGMGKPHALFIDRRGQVAGFDIFSTATNKNMLITGGSGGGKSFFSNYLVGSYLATGAKVRIIDVGKSYEKLCKKTGGQFIEFAGSELIINFFDSINELDGDTLAMLVSVVMTMAYSRTGSTAEETEMALIELAISEVFKVKGKLMIVDDVADFLAHLDGHFDGSDSKHEMLIQAGAALAVALEKYTSRGGYGRYFCGKSNVSFTKDFVVVELDGVSEELRRVIVLAFAMLIESEIYNGDRNRETLVLLDEAWQTLNNPAAAKFCIGLYRKARKYNASIAICVQSIMDTHKDGALGATGAVARDQSSFWIALPDNGLDAAKSQQVINMDDYVFNTILRRMPVNSKPNYSEFSVTVDWKFTVALRLIVDMYSYFLYTSDAKDNSCLGQIEERLMMKDPTLDEFERGAQAIELAAMAAKSYGGVVAFRNSITNILEAI